MRPWTDDDITRACALRRQGMSNRCIGAALNRHPSNVARKLAGHGFPRMQGNQWGVRPVIEAPAPRPPTSAEIGRQALLAARSLQDPISSMLGDPPPGWSALDRMRIAPMTVEVGLK
jgi:hypothetical protein